MGNGKDVKCSKENKPLTKHVGFTLCNVDYFNDIHAVTKKTSRKQNIIKIVKTELNYVCDSRYSLGTCSDTYIVFNC